MTERFNSDSYRSMVTQPLAPITLRVGVVGHRSLPSDQLPRLHAEIGAIYREIGETIIKLGREVAAVRIYAQQTPIVRIISSLAEGADRLLVDPELIAIDCVSVETACILPFIREEFEKDFFPGTVSSIRKMALFPISKIFCSESATADRMHK